jgi:hypothetical protein
MDVHRDEDMPIVACPCAVVGSTPSTGSTSSQRASSGQASSPRVALQKPQTLAGPGVRPIGGFVLPNGDPRHAVGYMGERGLFGFQRAMHFRLEGKASSTITVGAARGGVKLGSFQKFWPVGIGGPGEIEAKNSLGRRICRGGAARSNAGVNIMGWNDQDAISGGVGIRFFYGLRHLYFHRSALLLGVFGVAEADEEAALSAAFAQGGFVFHDGFELVDVRAANHLWPLAAQRGDCRFKYLHANRGGVFIWRKARSHLLVGMNVVSKIP